MNGLPPIPEELICSLPTDVLPGGMAMVKLVDWTLLQVSPGLSSLMGFRDRKALKEAVAGSLWGLIDEGDRSGVRTALDRLLQAGGRTRVECRLVRRSCPPLWVTLCAGLVRSQDWGVYLHCFFLDLTNLRRTEAELAEQCRVLTEKSRREAMTGLLNKEAFREDVKRCLAEAGPGDSCALLVVDLDDFKHVNDCFGHTFGDRVLQTFAAILVETFGTQVLCGRYGGDEFVVFLPKATPADVERTIRSFYRSLRCRRKEDLHFRCSIGVSCATGSVSYGQLFDRADTALYDAKHQGKNRYVMAAL